MSRWIKIGIVLAIGVAAIIGLVASSSSNSSSVSARKALEVAVARYPADDLHVADALQNLADAYLDEGHAADAEPLLKHALSIRVKSLGLAHRDVRNTIMSLSKAYSSMGRIEESSLLFAVAMQTFSLHETTDGGTEVRNWFYLVRDGRDTDPEIRNMAFLAAQYNLTGEAAKALNRMTERAVAGHGLSGLVREYQDLSSRRRDVLNDVLMQMQQDSASSASLDRLREYMDIRQRTSALLDQIKAQSPNYEFLADTLRLGISEVQNNLAVDEALVVYLDTSRRIPSGDTYFWVVTKTQSRWGRIAVAGEQLRSSVETLRCGLDYEGAWNGRHCNELLNTDERPDDEITIKPLPFDLDRAQALYTALFGQIEDLIKDKQLLIVPSGPLTQLPFQVLVTAPPRSALPGSPPGYRDVAWLARAHAIMVLPAVSSLKALRQSAKPSQASDPYIGFGNPLLDGDPASFAGDAERAELAREKQCGPRRLASIGKARGGARMLERGANGVINVADIRRQLPLPETADELCDVALDLGVDPATHVYLGARATETEIKRLSQDGSLASHRIVHFATHGLVAGDLLGASEPGLLLTPPQTASDIDDGYLSASEVAALKLDADWVILSACNTAAGNTEDAEALSGLARAFFYAGARSLLVSHWSVNSDAAVKLITKAVAELKSDPKIGRAEALRRAMLAMIDNGKEGEAHPALWAPFVLVGEGAAAR